MMLLNSRDRSAVIGLVCIAAALAGMTLGRNITWRTSIDLWQDTLAKSPQKARVNYQLGRVYGDAGDRDRAFQYMGRAKQLDPAFFNKLLSRAEDYRRRGMLKEATEEYRKLLADDPGQTVIRNDLGCVLHAQGMRVEAFREFTEAVRLEPAYAMAYANRGVINIEWGMLDDAITDYRKAVELDPKNANFHAKLGFAYLKKGQLGEAIAAYDSALRIDPGHEQARNERDEALLRWRAAGGAPKGH